MLSTQYYLEAVIFDMDGVITHTMPDHHRAWKDVLANYGVEVSHHDIYSREGQPGDEALKEIFDKYGVSFKSTDIVRILAEKEAHFKANVRQRFVPGSRTLLKNLQGEGFRLGLVTGTAQHELDTILPRHIKERFEVIVTGDEVTKGKPNPEPFLLALSRLQLQPNDAVVIENAPYGIRSAKSAGLSCLALETSLSEEYLSQADGVYRSINHMTDEVEFVLKNDD